MLGKHLHEPPAPVSVLRPDLPRKLTRAIDRCLEKHPDDRFSSAEELADAVSEARARVREVPPVILEARRQIELLFMDAVGWGALSTMVFVDSLLIGSEGATEAGVKVAVYLLSAGLVASRTLRVVAAVRAATARGFDVQHLMNALLELTAGLERRSDRGPTPGLRPAFEPCAFLTAFVVLALGHMFAFGEVPDPLRDGLWDPLLFYVWLVWDVALLMLPVVTGRAMVRRALERWEPTQRLWAQLWRGHTASRVLRFACIGLRARRGGPPEARHTEALVAGAAADLFRDLPVEYQHRLAELPELVNRLEAAASALRERDAKIERAVAAVGTVGHTVNRHLGAGSVPVATGEYSSVRTHRADAVGELDAIRSMLEERLAATMAALENLRLGLLRLQAGIGTPDELTEDLRAARELGREVQALLDGERQVEGLLKS